MFLLYAYVVGVKMENSRQLAPNASHMAGRNKVTMDACMRGCVGALAGMWKDGLKTGQGSITWGSGRKFEGRFSDVSA